MGVGLAVGGTPVRVEVAAVDILQAPGVGIPCSPSGVQVGAVHAGEDPGSSSLPGSNLHPFHVEAPSCPVHALYDPHSPPVYYLGRLLARLVYTPPEVKKDNNEEQNNSARRSKNEI